MDPILFATTPITSPATPLDTTALVAQKSAMSPLKIVHPISTHLFKKINLDALDRAACLAKVIGAVALIVLSLVPALISSRLRQSIGALCHSIRLNANAFATGIKIKSISDATDPILHPERQRFIQLDFMKHLQNEADALTAPIKARETLLSEQQALLQNMKDNLAAQKNLDQLENKIKDLIDSIGKLKNKKQIFENKIALFQRAQDIYQKHNCQSEIKPFRLQDESAFHLDTNKSPDYFKQTFNSAPSTFEVTEEFYTYQPTSAQHHDIQVDFANTFLGGGCFTEGNVQEEKMVQEMPDFAAFISRFSSPERAGWCTILTRQGKNRDQQHRVLGGNPKPLLIKGLNRVQAIGKETYKEALGKLSKQEALAAAQELPSPQKVDVVAIAGPKLDTKNPQEQWHPNTLKDLFNTCMAGFTLCKEQAKPGKTLRIHSGKLAAGVFNNDITAVYLVERLAAQQLGVELKLWGYTASEAQRGEAAWQKLQADFQGKSLETCLQIISQKALKGEI